MGQPYFKRRRQRLHKIDPHCCYCGVLTVLPTRENTRVHTPNMATIEHIYSRLHPYRTKVVFGKEKSLKLACKQCNEERSLVPVEIQRQRSGGKPHYGWRTVRFFWKPLCFIGLHWGRCSRMGCWCKFCKIKLVSIKKGRHLAGKEFPCMVCSL